MLGCAKESPVFQLELNALGQVARCQADNHFNQLTFRFALKLHLKCSINRNHARVFITEGRSGHSEIILETVPKLSAEASHMASRKVILYLTVQS